jgi:hypothetical protein
LPILPFSSLVVAPCSSRVRIRCDVLASAISAEMRRDRTAASACVRPRGYLQASRGSSNEISREGKAIPMGDTHWPDSNANRCKAPVPPATRPFVTNCSHAARTDWRRAAARSLQSRARRRWL